MGCNTEDRITVRNTYFSEAELTADLSPDEALCLPLHLALNVEVGNLLSPIHGFIHQTILEADGATVCPLHLGVAEFLAYLHHPDTIV